ncbi:MAG TPA: DUF423 domain-containing protein [Acetobacteraceae bacterium]|nr:DUF423 domain-containing protein [Acetobacteraceae bacterium]
MQRLWIGLGALAGLTAVMMAALAAHALPQRLDAERLRLIDSALRMQGWHALALVGIGLWAGRASGAWATGCANAAGAATTLGLLLFCGAVYTLALTGLRFGPIAPVGGTLLMLGWALLGLSVLRAG